MTRRGGSCRRSSRAWVSSAVGWQRYEIAILLSLLTFLTLTLVPEAKKMVNGKGSDDADS